VDLIKEDAFLSDEEPHIEPDEKRKRLSDEAMKAAAFERTMHELDAFKCGSECKTRFGGTGNCVKNAFSSGCFEDIMLKCRQVWGSINAPAPSSKERGSRLWEIQSSLYDPNKKEFNYCFQSSSQRKQQYICEASFAFLLGFNGHKRTTQFVKNKMLLQKGLKRGDPVLEALKSERSSVLLEKCMAYIGWFRDTHCDKLPKTQREAEADGTGGEVYVLPYEKVRDFYGEYVMYCHDRNIGCCSESTFRNALNHADFKDSVRLMR